MHAAEMIGVAVRVDHRANRPVAAVVEVEPHRGGGDLHRGQRVDDDDAGVALHDGQVGEIEATHLEHPLGHLEQTVVHVQPGHAPQAGVHRRRRGLGIEERVWSEVPDGCPAGGADDGLGQAGDEAARGVGEVREIGGIGQQARGPDDVAGRSRVGGLGHRRSRRSICFRHVAHCHPPSRVEGESCARARCPRSARDQWRADVRWLTPEEKFDAGA